jgi:hypothetical protein
MELKYSLVDEVQRYTSNYLLDMSDSTEALSVLACKLNQWQQIHLRTALHTTDTL